MMVDEYYSMNSSLVKEMVVEMAEVGALFCFVFNDTGGEWS